MKKLIYSFAFVLIVHCTLNIQNCDAQWVPASSPIGGTVNCIFYNNGNIYAGTRYAIYISSNDGLSWNASPVDPVTNFQINALTKSGSNILAGASSSGAYYSTNNGSNWTQSDLNNKSVLSFEVAGATVYAGTFLYGVYKSTNNGQNWIQTYLNNREVRALHNYNGTLFAGTSSYGILYSTDEGSSWLPTSMTSQTVNDIKSSGTTIFAGAATGIFTSINGGLIWSSNPFFTTSVWCLKKNGPLFFAGTRTDGIYKTTNNGGNWTQASLSGQYVRSIEAKSTDSMYAGLDLSGLYKSLNGGTSFEQTTLSSIVTKCFTQSGNNLYIGTDGNGVFRVTSVWLQRGLIDKVVNTIAAVVHGDSTTFIAGTQSNGVYVSNDSGASWTNKIPSAMAASYISFDSGATIKAIYVTTYNAIYTSIDYGNTFQQTSFSGANPKSLCVRDSNIFAGTEINGVYKRSRNVDNWTQTTLNTNTVGALVSDDSSLYAGTQSNGVKKTTDYGANWTQYGMNGLFITTMFAGLINTNGITANKYLFAGTQSNGVYFSKNNSNWIQANQGFTNTANIGAMIFYNDKLIVATNRPGLWSRPIAEFVIGIKPISTEVPTEYYLYQNYPNPFNPTTVISFQLLVVGKVSLKVYDELGREVANLVNEHLQPGTYEIEWNASQYTSGVYFYRLIAGDYTETKKMLLIK